MSGFDVPVGVSGRHVHLTQENVQSGSARIMSWICMWTRMKEMRLTCILEMRSMSCRKSGTAKKME